MSVRRIRWVPVVAVVLYALAAWVLYRPLGLLDRSRLTLGDDGNDIFQQVWLLGLAHSELVRGHLSFFTSVIDPPRGINLLDNASMPLLAVAMSPVTAVAGPIAAYGLLLRLALLASSTACMLALRKVIASDLAAAAGGAVYAFAPYMTHQATLHVFLTFVPVPPVIAVIVYRRLTGDGDHPWRSGLLLGVLAVVQYLIDSEVLVSLVLVLGITVILLGVVALVRRRRFRARLWIVLRLVVGAAVVAVPLLAYPAWFALSGPQHVSGPVIGVGRTAPGPSAVLKPPLNGLLASPSHVTSVRFGNQPYLGIVLVVVLVAVIALNYRNPLVRAVTVMGVVGLVLSFGPRLRVGHMRIQMPFELLQKLPAVQNLAPTRMSFYVDAAAAVLVAVGVAWCRARATRTGWWKAGLGAVAIVAGLSFLVPVVPFASTRTKSADAFSGRAVRIIPIGALAVTYPQPGVASAESMAWQAESGMRFDLLGGYAVHSRTDGGFARNPYFITPIEIAAFFGQLRARWSPATVRSELPGFARATGVTVALVAAGAHGARRVVRILSEVYGPPERIGGVDAWTDLNGLIPIYHGGPANPLFPAVHHP